MVGMAGATMVWSSAASSIDSSTPPMMTFFSRSLERRRREAGHGLFADGLSIDPLNPPAPGTISDGETNRASAAYRAAGPDIGAVDLAVDLVGSDGASDPAGGTAGLPTGMRFLKQRRRTSRPR